MLGVDAAERQTSTALRRISPAHVRPLVHRLLHEETPPPPPPAPRAESSPVYLRQSPLLPAVLGASNHFSCAEQDEDPFAAMDAELDEALASAASGPLSARAAAVATVGTLDSSLAFICSSLACEHLQPSADVRRATRLAFAAYIRTRCQAHLEVRQLGLRYGSSHERLSLSWCHIALSIVV